MDRDPEPNLDPGWPVIPSGVPSSVRRCDWHNDCDAADLAYELRYQRASAFDRVGWARSSIHSRDGVVFRKFR